MTSRIASIARGGLGAFLLAALGLAIAGNALLFQGSDHPAPLFASNGAEPPSRSVASTTEQAEATPPIVRPRPDPVVMAIQQILTDRGYYSGEVDGLAGIGTQRAVKAYQVDAGQNPSGLADADLLMSLQQDRQPAPLPSPSPKSNTQDGIAGVIAAVDDTSDTEPLVPSTASKSNSTSNLVISEIPASPVQQPKAQEPVTRVVEAPVAQPVAQTMQVADEPKPDPRIRAVQEALTLSAYGSLEADGLMGPQTADAIRRFQLDQGMSVTGEIDDGLVSRLIRVGAMAANY